MRRARLGLGFAAVLGGCDGIQSMTEGAGFQGEQFSDLFTVFFAVTGFFYILVILGLIGGLILRRRGEADEKAARIGLVSWLGAVLVGLTGLTIASYVMDRNVAAASPANPPLEVQITGNQWWWDVTYKNGVPGEELRTANELHLPVGVPVKLTLKTNDVIHSFWVPALGGKQDLIPGRTNTLTVLPTRVGTFRGQCAEFCGAQHAHMALDVTIEPLGAFRKWWTAGLAPAAPPATPLAQAGYRFVMTQQCASCHNISGTPASGRFGPDLTHVASRRSIGAGTFPMTKGHLFAWVADPQGAKPGNHMPYVGLNADQLHAVVAYLGGLK
ncbi:MAG TPA: c-type cytochrome [Sphingomonas sp.]|nr:c-type cytochrome [Sphingomonas sp.]